MTKGLFSFFASQYSYIRISNKPEINIHIQPSTATIIWQKKLNCLYLINHINSINSIAKQTSVRQAWIRKVANFSNQWEPKIRKLSKLSQIQGVYAKSIHFWYVLQILLGLSNVGHKTSRSPVNWIKTEKNYKNSFDWVFWRFCPHNIIWNSKFPRSGLLIFSMFQISTKCVSIVKTK